MGRKIKDACKEAGRLFWRDVRRLKAPLIVLTLYFIFMKKVFHMMCPMVLLTGFPCPGCGLTRAGVALLQGDFRTAWEQNLMIYPIVLFVIVYIVFRYFLKRDTKKLSWLLLVILAAMIVYYIYRMCRYFPGEPPMSYYHDALITFMKKQ